MNFDYDDGQLMMRETVSRFVGPFDIAERHRIRALPAAYDRARWSALADLGLLAVAVPEDQGGIGGGLEDFVSLAECFGRTLALDPWLENGLFPIVLAQAAGAADDLAAMMDGSQIGAVAWATGNHDFEGPQPASAAPADTRKLMLGAALADRFWVVRSERTGLSVDPIHAADAEHFTRYPILDGTIAADLRLFAAPSNSHSLSAEAFANILSIMRLCAAAEMLGLAQRMHEETLEYVRTRQQFGVAIGSFQALQHRLVDGYAALEQSRSLILRTTLQAADMTKSDWLSASAGCKAFVQEAALLVGREAIQMHGGMGQTDELAIGHAYKRVLLLSSLFGTTHQLLCLGARL